MGKKVSWGECFVGRYRIYWMAINEIKFTIKNGKNGLVLLNENCWFIGKFQAWQNYPERN